MHRRGGWAHWAETQLNIGRYLTQLWAIISLGDGRLPGTEAGCRLNLTRLKEDEVISHCCSPDGVPSETGMAA